MSPEVMTQIYDFIRENKQKAIGVAVVFIDADHSTASQSATVDLNHLDLIAKALVAHAVEQLGGDSIFSARKKQGLH